MSAHRQKKKLDQLIQTERFGEAKELCAAICRRDPADVESWFKLGAINGQIGLFDEAESCCDRAIRLCPTHPMLHFNQGIARFRQEKLEQAAESFIKAIQLNPSYAEALHELGNVRQSQCRYEDAVPYYVQTIKHTPNNHLVFFNLGKAYSSMCKWGHAINAYNKAIVLMPDFEAAYNELSDVRLNRYQYDKVMELLAGALPRFPKSFDLHYKLGVACQESGETDKAYEYYIKCLALEPENANARASLAGIVGLQGDYKKAQELIEPLLSEETENPTAVITFAHFAHKFQREKEAEERVEKLLKDNDLQDSVRSKVSFALGKLLDSRGEYAAAFSAYNLANSLKGEVFSKEEAKRLFAAIKEVYSAENIACLPVSRNTSSSPIFILGMPRSGTTLTEQILASHPAVFGAGELHTIQQLIVSMPDRINSDSPYPWCMSEINVDLVEDLAALYRKEVDNRSGGAPRVTDKLPSNFINLGFINLLFPSAKIVHCLRDPMDTCLSCYFHNFSGDHSYSYALEDLGFYYNQYLDLMNHWKQVLSIPVMDIRYEELISDQDSISRKLVDFCGLDWDDNCLGFYKTSRTVSTASHDQVRQPIYTRAVGRSEHYMEFLAPLKVSLDRHTKE